MHGVAQRSKAQAFSNFPLHPPRMWYTKVMPARLDRCEIKRTWTRGLTPGSLVWPTPQPAAGLLRRDSLRGLKASTR